MTDTRSTAIRTAALQEKDQGCYRHINSAANLFYIPNKTFLLRIFWNTLYIDIYI